MRKMKQLLSILLAMTFCTAPCHAQFGTLSKIINGVKAVKQAKKDGEKILVGKTVKENKDQDSGFSIDTTSVEYQKAKDEFLQSIYDKNPQLKRMKELENDPEALKKYMEEQYGGMSGEEITNKTLKDFGIDINSREFQDAYTKVQNMSSFTEDPIFKKAMSEKRQLTMEEATYLNEKYGTSFEYAGMEAYNDSVGVFANLDGKMKPMNITKSERITDERPVPDFGQDEIKQYVQEFLSVLKKPIADKEIIDRVQNYMIYNHRHADEQFKGTAKFTIYSNPEIDPLSLTATDIQLRRVTDFDEPIDPQNIFVFRVHKGIDCRFMEYMYSQISYKQSELNDYISNRLIADGDIDASINKKISDDQLFRNIDRMEFQFKVEKLLKMRKNNEKFLYTNTVPAANNVKIKSNVRKVGGHITALDISVDAEPGEYAFVIRNPEVEESLKQMVDDSNFDISVLTQGAFFFTVK